MVAAGSNLLLKPQTIVSKEVNFFYPVVIGSQLVFVVQGKVQMAVVFLLLSLLL